MKRTFILVLILWCSTAALDHSHRIKSLGTDFANLIPDYETDLYRDPQILNQGIAGISFEPTLVYYYRQSLYLYIPVRRVPVTLQLMYKKLGLMGQYWLNYSHELRPHDYGWHSSTYKAFRINDIWMYRVRKAVINLYNDLDYSRINYLTSTNSESIESSIEYIARTQFSLQLREPLRLDLKLGYGFYESRNEIDNSEISKQRINLGLARIGVYCRNISRANDFTSWYVVLGSPMTNREIDSLPYSVYSQLAENETEFVTFARTLMVRFAIARALPITNHGFVAVGIKNSFLYQDTENVAEANDLRGIVNMISLPIGFEYRIKAVTLRFGTRFHYDFQSLRTADESALSHQTIEHGFGYAYSFGLGWQPHKNVTLDIYNNGNLSYITDWALYVKYLF
jgi:hypothetical protein